MKVLVTGASGFVGRAVCSLLVTQKLQVAAAVRRTPRDAIATVDYKIVPSLTFNADWSNALEGVEVVIHSAAKVHQPSDQLSDAHDYNEANVNATVNLAKQSLSAGVRRLVFISSVKVNGERSVRCFSEEDPPSPLDPYARSKLGAERALFALARKTPLEVVVVRPPLVYGPGVQANFLRLLQIIDRGLPLPLAGIRNRRSFVYVENLASAILACAVRAPAAGEVFFVGDGTDLSTPELIRALANALGRRPRLINVPLPLLRIVAAVPGRSAALTRVTDSLCINTDKIRKVLDWSPPFPPSEGFARTAAWYLAR